MGLRIKEIREEKGMSASELCEKANIARATLWGLENVENREVMSKTLLNIAKVLGVKIDDLFSHDGD